jgi:hypothetical protein
VLTLMALAATAAVATAGSVLYLSGDGFGKAGAGPLAPASPTTGASTTVSAPSCH